ncbi:YkvA family protein [Carboxydothermus ferrireducens]|uniref:YkvA family protein n=1 Tax=Carboxydothermus ferrireducens TaxID=54265 RepID=UPI0003FB7A18|nr:YkvA family protein [Carboxydothermus ferrireducens]
MEDVMKKAKNQGPIGEIWDKLTSMIGLFKDWINGNYNDVSTATILAIIIGLIYFVSPVDTLLDFIPLAGYVDDAFVLGLIFNQVKSEIEKYQAWKNKN